MSWRSPTEQGRKDSKGDRSHNDFGGETSPRSGSGLSQKLRKTTEMLERFGAGHQQVAEASTAPYVPSMDSSWDHGRTAGAQHGYPDDDTWDMHLDKTMARMPSRPGKPPMMRHPPMDQSEAVDAAVQGARAAVAAARGAQQASHSDTAALEKSVRAIDQSHVYRAPPPPPPPPPGGYDEGFDVDLDTSVGVGMEHSRSMRAVTSTLSYRMSPPAMDYADLDRSVCAVPEKPSTALDYSDLDCTVSDPGSRREVRRRALTAPAADLNYSDMDKSVYVQVSDVPSSSSLDPTELANELKIEREKRKEYERRVDEAEYVACWLKEELDRSVQETRELEAEAEKLRTSVSQSAKLEVSLRSEIAEMQQRMDPNEVEQLTMKMTGQLVSVEGELQARTKDLSELGGPFLQNAHELLRTMRHKCARLDTSRDMPPLFDQRSWDLQGKLRNIIELLGYIAEVIPSTSGSDEPVKASKHLPEPSNRHASKDIPRTDSARMERGRTSPQGSHQLNIGPFRRTSENRGGHLKEYTAPDEVTRLGFQFFPFDKRGVPPGTVEKVLPESWAEAMGICVGDQVFQVNGDLVEEMDENSFLNHLGKRPVTLSTK